MVKKTFQIAIDGPVAAGKGTVAKLVSGRLGFLYVDTGAMYRGSAYYAMKNGIDWTNQKQVEMLIENDQPLMELRIPKDEMRDGRLCTLLLNNEDVSWKIRTEEVSKASSPVAQYPKVREYVNKLARKIAGEQDVVMEGRDITGVVLPNANLKIYMNAEPMERAKRRHKELMMRGEDIAIENVYRELMERDKRDMERNLKVVPGVWVLDTTKMTIEEVVNTIIKKVEEIK